MPRVPESIGSPPGSAPVVRRVLVVVSTTQRRGAEIDGLALTTSLAQRDVTARCVALVSGPAGAVGLDGVEVLGRRPFSPATLWRLRRAARRADVVVAYGSTALPACAVALVGLPSRFVYRSVGELAPWLRGRLHRWRTRWLLGRPEVVVALWPGAADELATFAGLPPKRVVTIPTGRSTTRFHPPTAAGRAAARRSLGVDGPAPVLLCVGALAPEKQVHLAIEALAGRPDGVLLVAGDGPQRQRLTALAAAVAPGRVRFLGSVEDVGPLYHAADVLVVPSATEGLPGVVIEAACSGCAVVAADVGGIGWFFSHGVAGRLLTPPVTATTLGAAVAEVLGEPREQGAAGDRNARGAAPPDAFALDVVTDQWLVALGVTPPT